MRSVFLVRPLYCLQHGLLTGREFRVPWMNCRGFGVLLEMRPTLMLTELDANPNWIINGHHHRNPRIRPAILPGSGLPMQKKRTEVTHSVAVKTRWCVKDSVHFYILKVKCSYFSNLFTHANAALLFFWSGSNSFSHDAKCGFLDSISPKRVS